MMVALLLYCYAVVARIERRWVGDVATRLITANQAPITRRSPAFAAGTRAPLGEL
jgi:hypothetical protein